MSSGNSSDGKKGELPRIIVLDDEIIVLEEDWVEKNVKTENIEYDKPKEDEDVLSQKTLEKTLEAVEQNAEVDTMGLMGKDSTGFYNSDRDIGALYNPTKYETENTKLTDDDFIDIEASRKKGSSLEISGFRDEEAEKRRKSKYWVG